MRSVTAWPRARGGSGKDFGLYLEASEQRSGMI